MSLVSVAPELVVMAVPDVARIGLSIDRGGETDHQRATADEVSADVVALFGWSPDGDTLGRLRPGNGGRYCARPPASGI